MRGRVDSQKHLFLFLFGITSVELVELIEFSQALLNVTESFCVSPTNI